MSMRIGIDIGAVGAKAALVIDASRVDAIIGRNGSAAKVRRLQSASHLDQAVLVLDYRRTRGRPLDAARVILAEIAALVGDATVDAIVVTGSASGLIGTTLRAARCNEFQALARAMDRLHPDIRTVLEMGGETSKFIRLEPDSASGTLGILDYSTNGDCAAGTGAFLDQQASRLKYTVEEIGTIVAGAERAAQIAGRCSVFAKSDMIHAQQKAFTPPEVLRGLCNAVAVNYKSAVVKGREIVAPAALVGGVSANSAVVRSLRETFDLDETSLRIPEAAESMAAVGAAIVATDEPAASIDLKHAVAALERAAAEQEADFSTSPPLSMERVVKLNANIPDYDFPADGSPIDVYLGLDIGSVGTKLVMIDERGDVVHSIFTRTEGRPIEVVSRSLREIEEAVGARVRIRSVGTTGSGRELIGELVGADAITDEITCHKTGASFVGERLLSRRPDTIFEIGGQDSKYISLEPAGGGSPDSVVVDFTMNEACAAGTGSFLEERAEELGVSIKGEFSQLALSSTAPVRLGERCTVFMERDVNTCMQRGAKREDIIAGLAYSIAYNYINRVVRGRPVGKTVFFQGGTAYNDAVAAAFSAITGKEIIIPPHNAVLGAIGAALVANEKVSATGAATRFRGFDMSEVDYAIREFTCKGCGNHCSVQEFTVEGEKTFWGDKCSDRYRKRAKTEHKPVIPDLVALRQQLLKEDDHGDPAGATQTIGIPIAMYSLDLLPFWRRFWRDCGFKVVLSEETNRRTVQYGYDHTVAEPCFPIIVAHGHVGDLARKNVDYIWLPNILSRETQFMENESHVCPWGQTLPFVVRQAPAFRSWQGRILCPTIRFRDGADRVRDVLVQAARDLGVSKTAARKAFDAGLAAVKHFRDGYQKAGADAVEILKSTGETGMVVIGRPYNIHDAGVSLSTARKLREFYGVNVLPIDALPTADVDVTDINDNMYWDYGRRILAAAKLVGEHPNLHIIYITNFKCGPDSFVKGFIRPASGKPFLTLQFDGHSNDAGMMTRCEAYLDSKGILRWWRKSESEAAPRPSKDEHSTSPKWPTPAPG